MFALVAALFPLACSGSSDDGSGGGGGGNGVAELTIASPTAGSEWELGEAVPLEVTATKAGRDVPAQGVQWTIGDWAGQGASTEATGLLPGEHTVTATATVDGEEVTASVDITVTGPASVDYEGRVTAEYTLDADFEVSDACNGPITFTVMASGAVSGSGTTRCVSDWVDDFNLDFTVEGTLSAGTLSGNFVFSSDGQEERVPFTGSGRYNDGDLTGSFDNTFSSADGSLRFNGSFTASPR